MLNDATADHRSAARLLILDAARRTAEGNPDTAEDAPAYAERADRIVDEATAAGNLGAVLRAVLDLVHAADAAETVAALLERARLAAYVDGDAVLEVLNRTGGGW